MKKPQNIVGKGLVATFFAAVVGYGGVSIVGFSDEPTARQELEKVGYSVVEYKGHTIDGCMKGDIWRDRFIVENKDGKEMEVVVCRGPFVGTSIRF